MASILTGLATGVGSIPLLFFKKISSNLLNSMLDMAAGVMLAATAFALIIPGIEFGNTCGLIRGVWFVVVGMLIGAYFLHYSDEKLPHFHFGEIGATHQDTLQKISLFIIAITIHNFPEGMSLGVSFGGGDIKKRHSAGHRHWHTKYPRRIGRCSAAGSDLAITDGKRLASPH